jgi:hypothetical protein
MITMLKIFEYMVMLDYHFAQLLAGTTYLYILFYKMGVSFLPPPELLFQLMSSRRTKWE